MGMRPGPSLSSSESQGEVIGQSEMYSSVAARDKGIASVKANGATSDIRDET